MPSQAQLDAVTRELAETRALLVAEVGKTTRLSAEAEEWDAWSGRYIAKVADMIVERDQARAELATLKARVEAFDVAAREMNAAVNAWWKGPPDGENDAEVKELFDADFRLRLVRALTGEGDDA